MPSLPVAKHVAAGHGQPRPNRPVSAWAHPAAKYDQAREDLLRGVERNLLARTFVLEVADEPQRVAVVENSDHLGLASESLQKFLVAPVSLSHYP